MALVVLWAAFLVATVVAFVSIIAARRYPPALFRFNLGVLRWSWRVSYYGYSALGTDRYPPFTLGEEPDYPATLDIAYPEPLSRGLVLVKWWLLAVPHHLVLSVLTGGAAWTLAGVDGTDAPKAVTLASGGLIGVLVAIAAVALLFTARYPGGLHDLVVGLNRWMYRVIAYAGLMTDVYPPFRLDQGEAEPVRPEGPRPSGSTDEVTGPGFVAPAPPLPA